jgi:hypothetical protein
MSAGDDQVIRNIGQAPTTTPASGTARRSALGRGLGALMGETRR